ncbi:hypothetical protein LJB77_02945, partial [Ruminococcaceae bacterium OttesenSCG-928-N02]|nr:hypothetical protein [Ruminococcaceae bacterium OttesenSCG-928-N02]
SKLKNKLDAFLPLAPLTVVYPVAAVKWVRWLDTQTGELTDPRRSPKKGMCADVLHELVYIKDYFHHENLRFMVPLIEVEEVRLLNGWGAAGKRGAHRAANYPIALLDVQHIAGAKAFKNLLPPGLTRPFTAAQLAKAMQRGPHFGTRAANALRAMGSIQQVGKAPGGAYLYE